MSGTYMGKDWTNVEYLFKLYEIGEPKVILTFMQMIDRVTVNYRMQEAEAKRKADEAKKKAAAKKKAEAAKKKTASPEE